MTDNPPLDSEPRRFQLKLSPLLDKCADEIACRLHTSKANAIRQALRFYYQALQADEVWFVINGNRVKQNAKFQSP